MSESNWSVGAVAERCGVRVSTLHFYEAKGLIHSRRNKGNQRRYSKDVIRRVSLIKAAQKVGVSLEEIGEALSILPEYAAPTQKDWQRMSRLWQKTLKTRIQYLERLSDLLDGCIGCGCLSMKACPMFNKDDFLAEKGPGPVRLEGRISG